MDHRNGVLQPPQPQLAAQIVINMTPDGQIGLTTNGHVPPTVFVGMLEFAKHGVIQQTVNRPQQQIEVAPAGMSVARTDG